MEPLIADELRRLHETLVAAFEVPDLRLLVRFTLPNDYDSAIHWDQPRNHLVNDLLQRVEQHGDRLVFLRAVAEARPRNPDVTTIVSELIPKGTPRLSSEEATRQANGAFETSIRALKGIPIPAEFNSMQIQLHEFAVQIRQISSYKELHEILHRISDKLPEMRGAAEKVPADLSAQRLLRAAAIAIQTSIDQGRCSAEHLRSPEKDQEWLNEVERLRTSLCPPWTGALSAVESLHEPIENLVRINDRICTLASELRVQSVIDFLQCIEKRFPEMHINPTDPLPLGLSAMRQLRAEWTRRIAEHQEWQWLDKKFQLLDASLEFQPTALVRDWPGARTRLHRLCGLYPDEEWSVNLVAACKTWETSAQKNEREFSFLAASDFRAYGREQFSRVDRALLVLCGRMNEISIQIETIVEILGHATVDV